MITFVIGGEEPNYRSTHGCCEMPMRTMIALMSTFLSYSKYFALVYDFGYGRIARTLSAWGNVTAETICLVNLSCVLQAKNSTSSTYIDEKQSFFHHNIKSSSNERTVCLLTVLFPTATCTFFQENNFSCTSEKYWMLWITKIWLISLGHVKYEIYLW